MFRSCAHQRRIARWCCVLMSIPTRTLPLQAQDVPGRGYILFVERAIKRRGIHRSLAFLIVQDLRGQEDEEFNLVLAS